MLLVEFVTSSINPKQVAIIGKEEVFGDTDLVADVRKREHTAICYSANAEVYEIDRKVTAILFKNEFHLITN